MTKRSTSDALQERRARTGERHRNERKELAELIMEFANRLEGLGYAIKLNQYEKNEMAAALTRLRKVVDCMLEANPNRLNL